MAFLCLGCILILFLHFVQGVEVSDKIDFGSRESNSDFSSSWSAGSGVITLDADVPASARSPSKGFRARNPRPSDPRIFVNKPKTPGNIVPPDSNHSPRGLTVVNNIRIVVNGNETQSAAPKAGADCEKGVCGVSVSSTRDEKGNIITNVHLSVITRLDDIKVNDIPVIDGVRGTSFEDRSNYPNFSPNNVPQVYPHASSHFQPSFVTLKNHFFRAATDLYHSYSHDLPSNSWMTSRDIVDDKIESPLSKTSAS